MELVSLFAGNIPVYGFIFFATVASFFPGIPEEVFLITLGYTGATVGFGSLNFFEVAGMLVLGFMLNDSFVYYLSRNKNRWMLKFADLLLSGWFKVDNAYLLENMNKVIFFSRFVPQFRFIGSYFAGINKISFKRFLWVDFWALVIYTPLMLAIGAFFESRISEIINGVSVVTNIFTTIFSILLIIGLVRLVRKWFKTSYNSGRFKSFMGFVKIDKKD